MIDQFGRKRCEKKRKDVNYKLLEFFQKYFAVHKQLVVENSFSTLRSLGRETSLKTLMIWLKGIHISYKKCKNSFHLRLNGGSLQYTKHITENLRKPHWNSNKTCYKFFALRDTRMFQNYTKSKPIDPLFYDTKIGRVCFAILE